ncbi:uncharacterized protein LOC130668313 isoform X2 [Microplitis mediator]|nr:uncharacterized protein LOC130668313 isoform X2 [Microplitis mediator]XP_057326527.1 uncharacterized protein LOC130668313 isoform X2 [Microplitis mediator]
MNLPSTPTSCRLLNKKVLLSPINSSQFMKPTISGTRLLPINTQKSNNEIVRLLGDISSNIGNQNSRLDKIEATNGLLAEKVNNLSTSVQSAINQIILRGCGFKPDFLPFKTMDEVYNYAGMDENAHQQLIEYLSNYRGGETIQANLRYILNKDRLFTEELVSKLVYVRTTPGKEIIGGTRVDHDLFSVLKVMYPHLTDQIYKSAIKGALRAAAARVKARVKAQNEKNDNTSKKRKNKIPENFYENPYEASGSQTNKENEN